MNTMKYAINLLSVIPMRKEPAHRSEMVSQLLFGEYAEVIGKSKEFLKIKCLYDTYEGWVQAKQLEIVDAIKETDDFTASFSSKVLINDQPMIIPFGSSIHDVRKPAFVIGNNEVRYTITVKNYWNNKALPFDEYNLETVYTHFLNAPYLWGGKSVFGIDCSGFVQQSFKMFGIKLLRDAYLQATQGKEIKTLRTAKPCDLAFFKSDKGRVTHVGIILSNNRIVHASGKVRIDSIDKDGIINKETGERTHKLHSIKRFS